MASDMWVNPVLVQSRRGSQGLQSSEFISPSSSEKVPNGQLTHRVRPVYLEKVPGGQIVGVIICYWGQ